MYLPPGGSATSSNTKKVDILNFFGYDQREKIDDRQMSEMYNMSSDAIPAASPRKPREHIVSMSGISAITTPEYQPGSLDSFTGVAGNYFYYKGNSVTNIKLLDGEKSIVDFNGNICIFPDKVYYRYLPDPDSGKIENELKKMGRQITVTDAKFYSSHNEISGVYTAYIQKSGAEFDDIFKVGDSVIISGCSEDQNNTYVISSKKDYASDSQIVSAVVDEATTSKLSLLLYTKNGNYGLFKNTTDNNSVTIEISIPNISRACVHNNRLFGTGTSGEYIYASKLGDCFNFNSFRGLADDSWYSEIGTAGEFTGIVSYRTAVVAFKSNYIHHIYGDSPQSFSIPKQTCGGAIDGKSIAELGGILYYMGADGFYEYSGGEPEKISSCIKTNYFTCKSGTDGQRYYACAGNSNGTELLVYDPLYSLWHKEDNTEFIDFVRHNEHLYGVTKTDMYKFSGESNEEINWCVVSKKFTLDDFDFKGINTVYLRLDLKSGSKVKIYSAWDNEDFKFCSEIQGNGFMVHKVPVRFKKCDSFRIMLEGTGQAAVHDIEIITYTGGRTNAKHIR